MLMIQEKERDRGSVRDELIACTAMLVLLGSPYMLRPHGLKKPIDGLLEDEWRRTGPE